jgi:hypothetical protein
MSTQIKRSPVAFNLADPDQLAMYEHAKLRTNFSAYIKRLIQRDMEGLGGGQVRHYQEVADERDNVISVDLVSGLI